MTEAIAWLEEVKTTSEALSKYKTGESSVGVVLGTGQGALAQRMEVVHAIPYSEIPHFPTATVEFHKGVLLLGRLAISRLLPCKAAFTFMKDIRCRRSPSRFVC